MENFNNPFEKLINIIQLENRQLVELLNLYHSIVPIKMLEMLKDENTLCIDVRGEDEYSAGHVKDAISIPVDSILTRIDELPKDKTLLFICGMGVRSGLACEMAASMGLDTDKLYNIQDGTPAWIENKLPTEYGE